MESSETLVNDINKVWSDYWRTEPQGLDFTAPTTLYKFRYFLKPVLDRLPVGAKVCEIGCGNCQWLLLARSYRPDLQLWGLDLSDEAEKFAEKYGIIFSRQDIRNVQLPNDFFDFTFSWGVIEHMPESEKALSEQVRISRLSSVADVPYKYALSTLPLYKEIWQKQISQYDAMVRFGKFYSKRDFRKMVENVTQGKWSVVYRNNYLIFPQNFVGRILEKMSPDWLRGIFGHNVGAILVRRNSHGS